MLTKIELIDIILRVVKETWLPFLVGYDEQGNIVRSVDIFAHKEYNYYYEDGVLKRSVESDIVTDESDFVISKTAVVTVIYVYNNDGELAKERQGDGSIVPRKN